MIITPHAVVGAAVAVAVPEYPALGLALALSSHFILDAIPHWDYPIFSGNIKKDIAKLLADSALAWAITLFFFTFHGPQMFWLPVLGMGAAVLPDFHYGYCMLTKKSLPAIERFHQWAHSRKNLNHKPFLGIAIQILVIFLALAVHFW